jgi:NAD(P)-dependent dehydrogenase (short-subunit alcohol dehydrogenase family)
VTAEIDDTAREAASGARRPGRRLEGRRVLVVGAGGPENPDELAANGQAIAISAAREGAHVAVGDKDPVAAAHTVDAIVGNGGTATVAIADVRDSAACERLVGEATEVMGSIDGLVLNVGIGSGVGLAGTDPDAWDDVLAVNLRSHFLVCRNALPRFEGGSIVFIGSVAGLRPGTYSPSYDASKAGLIGLCRHVAMEGARKGVRANLVAPGLMDTPMGRGVSTAQPQRDRVGIPLGRQGTAWEVASATVFLLSDEASYITAQVLAVDGGLSTLPLPRGAS